MRYKNIENYTDPSKCCLTLLKISHHSHIKELFDSSYGIRTIYFESINGHSELTIVITQHQNGSPRKEVFIELSLKGSPGQTFQEFLDALFFDTLNTESMTIFRKGNDADTKISLEEFLNYLPYKTWKKYKRVYKSLFESNTDYISHKIR